MSIYEDDLKNRFPTYTFTETTFQDLQIVTVLDGATTIKRSRAETMDAAYKNLRESMVGGAEILLLLTTTQRNALTPIGGSIIFNEDNVAIEKYDGSNWVPVNSILEGNYTFQGSTKFGGDTSIDPLGAIHVVGDDPTTSRIRCIRFQDSATGAGSFQAGHSRGSEDTRDALVSGDRIGQYIFVGDNGVFEAGTGPAIRGITAENWSDTVRGSRIDFLTILPTTTAHNLAFTVSEHGYPEATVYTVATLPNVGNGGGIIMVSDETGGYVQAFSDGTNWRRVTDRAVVA
ncbi:MAG: hypothetical protein GY820_38395 [Gammaproteobacteria bacterium]|nr:hypothetical protein [Gammaproteobacteria bacterium]